MGVQFLQHMPGAGNLVSEIKGNTQHYISVIAEAADSQLATLSVSGQVHADVYDTLLEMVSSCCPVLPQQYLGCKQDTWLTPGARLKVSG